MKSITQIIAPIKLLAGTHSDTAQTGSGCFMNVIAYLNGEDQITDQSSCVCVTVRPLAILLNDTLTDAERPRMIPFIERAMGSATSDREELNRRCGLVVTLAQNMAKQAQESAKYAAESAECAAKYAAKCAAESAECAAEYAAKYAAKYAAESAAESAKYAAEYAAKYAAESAESAEYAAESAAESAECAAECTAKYAAKYAAESAECAAKYAAKCAAESAAESAAKLREQRVEMLFKFLDDALSKIPQQSCEFIERAEKLVKTAAGVL